MEIAAILSDNEYPVYGEELVSIEMEDREVFVISDLHMAAGLNENGNYDGTENFFADQSLSRFLQHLKTQKSVSKKALLIINGDFVDFLRIRNIPQSPEDFETWSLLLGNLGIPPIHSRPQVIHFKKRTGIRFEDE